MSVIDKLEEYLIAGLLALMTIVTCAQVLLRYVFNSGILWGMELTTYAFLWMVLLGLSYGIRTNSHIAVDLFVSKLPEGFRRLFVLVTAGLCLIYAGIMFWGAFLYIDRLAFLGIDGQDITLPKWQLSVILPIGFGMLILRLFQAFWDIYKGEREFLGGESEKGALMDHFNSDDTTVEGVKK